MQIRVVLQSDLRKLPQDSGIQDQTNLIFDHSNITPIPRLQKTNILQSMNSFIHPPPSQTEITCTSLPPSSSYRTSTGSWLLSTTSSPSVSSSTLWLLPASTSYQAKVDNSWYLLFKGSISFNPQLPCDMYCNLPGCPLLCWYEISSEGK